MSGDEKKLIRNSTVEFLLFTSAAGEDSIEVRYEDETIWLSQKMMAALFDVTVPTINVHLKNIYESGELTRDATIRKYLTVQIEGDREVSRTLDYYNHGHICYKPRLQQECTNNTRVFRKRSEQITFCDTWEYCG